MSKCIFLFGWINLLKCFIVCFWFKEQSKTEVELRISGRRKSFAVLQTHSRQRKRECSKWKERERETAWRHGQNYFAYKKFAIDLQLKFAVLSKNYFNKIKTERIARSSSKNSHIFIKQFNNFQSIHFSSLFQWNPARQSYSAFTIAVLKYRNILCFSSVHSRDGAISSIWFRYIFEFSLWATHRKMLEKK